MNLTDLAGVGAAGIEGAAARSELIVIEEVGPMELVSPEFRRAVAKSIETGKPLLEVVHERLEDDLLGELRSKAASLTTVTVENRDAVADALASKLLASVGGPKAGTGPSPAGSSELGLPRPNGCARAPSQKPFWVRTATPKSVVSK